MNKKSQFGLRSIVAVIVVFSFVFLFTGGASADSTIGTNILTTGNFESQNTASAAYFLTGNTIQVGAYASVAYSRFGVSATGHSNYVSTTSDLLISGDLEVRSTVSFATTASISGILYLANGQTRPGTGGDSATAFRFQNATGTLTVLTIDTTGNGRVGIGGTPGTTFEVQGTASASYFLTGNTIQVGGFASVAYNRFGTTATTHGHYIASSNDVFISGVASMSQAFWIGTNGKTGNVGVGTNAPTTKFEVSGSASVSTDFEVGGVASAATFVAKTNVLANSGRTASSSTTYVAEFGTLDTGTVSLLFGGNSSSTGTCFQLKSTDGTWIYMRFFTGPTTPTLSTTECN